MSLSLGIDIGGTFTDFTILDEHGAVSLWKEETTPDDPSRAIRTGLNAIARSRGIDAADFLRQTRLFVHGTTIATNTLIQRSGPVVGLLCTKGFRDILYVRDGFKPERFNLHLARPEDFVERHLRLGVQERIAANGEVVVPLSEDDVRAAAVRFRNDGVTAVAVSFLWSIVNPEHERRAAEILHEELDGIDLVCSVDVLPEIREWERTSATVLSAYALPRISEYLGRLQGLLRGLDFQQTPLIMQNNGGCTSVEDVLRRPVTILASGPAAAPAAAKFAARGAGEDLITVDMGGTSFDVCLIRSGRPAMSRDLQVEDQPIGVPGVEVHSIGAGGGSIAWIDSGGALRVGPRSAGARPGPVGYGMGGTEPTVTDANIVLGYISPEAFLGGRRRLHEDLAREAIAEKISAPLSVDTVGAAAGIIRVVNENMLGGIRKVSIERGIDPRGYLLVSGGGAGSLHAATLARRLGMRRVLIPKEASTFCSFGMAVTDVRHDHVRSWHARSRSLDLDRLGELFSELEVEARARLRAEGFADDDVQLERLVDARYVNQVHELTIAVPSVAEYSSSDLRDIENQFHDDHQERFAYSMPEIEVEFLHWRLAAAGLTGAAALWEKAAAAPTNGLSSDAESAYLGERDAYFEELGEGLVPTPVYVGEQLGTAATISGPAIVQMATTTIVVNPGDVLTAGANRSLVIAVAVDREHASGQSG